MKLTVPSQTDALFAGATDFADEWTPVIESSRETSQRIGGTAHLKDLKAEALSVLQSDDDEQLRIFAERGMGTRRAVLSLWATDKALAEQTMSASRVRQVAGWPVRLSRSGVHELLTIHLSYFTSSQRWQEGLFKTLREALADQCHAITAPLPEDSPLLAVQNDRKLLIGAKGPERVSTQLIEQDQSLASYLTARGLQTYRDSEYGRALIAQYFLRRIKTAEPSRPHEFLIELRTSEMLESLMDDGRYFGHHAVEALAAHHQVPHESWIDTVLAIAGDPRLKATPQWHKWWGSTSADAAAAVVGWLSRRDLQLFLEAFEEFAGNQDNIQRMFEDRKYFIEGLLEEGIIRETHLFLGSVALSHLQRRLTSDLNASITEITGNRHEAGPKAVIAMDCGDFQLVEGSHNFQLWVYAAEHVEELFDRGQDGVSLRYFTRQVPYGVEERNAGPLKAHRSFPHQGTTWQKNALEFLVDRGIAVPSIRRLMSPQAFDELKRIHGTPLELL